MVLSLDDGSTGRYILFPASDQRRSIVLRNSKVSTATQGTYSANLFNCQSVFRHKIQYFGGAPITMHTMLAYEGPLKTKFTHRVQFMTGGSPPPPSLMDRFTEVTGIEVSTLYGLTEVYGPVTRSCRDNTNPNRSFLEQLPSLAEHDMRVLNPDTMVEVPADGKTLGEVMIRGNVVMKGYFANEKATEENFKNGWFHTGDMAVNHGRGYFELKDRYKDIIISGGENVSTVEVENIYTSHPAVAEAAVVALADEKWGEVPALFVTLHANASTTEQELLSWGKTKMASFQAPKKVVIVEALPRNVAGKVQKFVLRDMLKAMVAK
jgi:fatty-acyl-CoA synthase